MIKVTNREVAQLLREIAAAYEVKDEDRFRIAAYNKAADSIEHASSEVKDIWEDKKLEKIPGIGKNIASYLDEFFKKGKVKHFEEVKRGLPEGTFIFLKIPGIGPKSAHKIAKNLNIKTIPALKKACLKHKIAPLEGFGEESEKNILDSIEKLERKKGRMLLPTALCISENYCNYLKKCPAVLKVDVVGSLRRGVATIGDIDIAVATKKPKEVIEWFIKYPEVAEILNWGGAKASVILKSNKQVDLRVQDPNSYGSLIQYFIGSKHHNIHLRKIAQERGLSLSEYGIKQKSGTIKEFSTEEAFYKELKMDWIPPELREDKGEIEAAQIHKLPRLVKLGDIKGDLQMHTIWSDGVDSALEMAQKCQDLGYEYLGISDHAPSVRVHGEKKVLKTIREWKREIEKINKKVRVKVFFGIEVNIAADISLALPDSILAEFDYCIGSIHTAFRQTKEKITQRIVMAIENPYITFIAHPTGRLLEEREGYEVDWDKVFRACLKYNKWLEINAYPNRLDLSDIVAREAKDRGVKLITNTDAHQKDQLEFIELGISVARRGWCEKKHIVNTSPLKQLLAEIEKGRKR